MRTYGRIIENGVKRWVVVETDAAGFNDAVWATTLIQCLKLNLNESPFYANHGIAAKESIVQQVFPDFDVARTQQQFARYFASLIVSKERSTTPTYKINITTNQGFKIVGSIAA